MDKRITFGTKDESNAQREREFLALTPHERFLWFLRSFNGRPPTDDSVALAKGNFIIRKRSDGPR